MIFFENPFPLTWSIIYVKSGQATLRVTRRDKLNQSNKLLD